MKQTLAVLLTMILCVGLFAGCGGSTGNQPAAEAPTQETQEPSTGETPAAEPTASGEGTTLTFWYWADNNDYSNTMQEMAKDFSETNELGITVVVEEYPWDGGKFSENLFTAVMGGGGPDAATFKLTSTPLFTANNMLASLDDLVDGWDGKGDIDDNLYSIMRQAGGSDTMYVMPWNTQILYVYYRPSMFEEVGIGVPQTYAEFLEACEKLTRDTDGDGKTDVYGFGMRGATNGHEPWGSFIQAAGGTFEDFTTPEAIQGMQDYMDLFTNGYVPPTAPTDGFNEIITNFKSGLTAMVVHHTGSFIEMEETFGDDVDAFQFPGDKGRWTSMGDTNTVIFESCENKEAAFEWLKYLSTGKGQETWCVTTGNIPVSTTVQNLPFFQENRFMKASIDGVSFAGIYPILDTTTEFVTTVWPSTTQQALLGQITAEEAMQEMQKALWE